MLGHAPYTGTEFLILCMSTSCALKGALSKKQKKKQKTKKKMHKIFDLIRQTVGGYRPGVRWYTSGKKSTNHLIKSAANYVRPKAVLTE